MKKVLSLLLAYLFLLTILPLGGVGVTAETVSSAVSQQAASIEALLEQVPATLQDTQVHMQLWWTPGEEDYAKEAAFEQATGIDIVYDSIAMDKYLSQQAMNIAAHKSSAIVALINEWYPRIIVNRLVQPISNVTGWNFDDESVYATSLMDQFAYKGERYGVAVKGGTSTTFHVMFFNKSILAKCGVEETPYDLWKAGTWNWDTCLDIALKCTKRNDGQHGMTNVGQYVWMLSADQDFVLSDETGLHNNISSKALYDTWAWNWDLINTYKVVDTSFTGQIPFFQGKAAMLGAGSYMMQADPSHTNYVPQNMKTEDWGVVPFPSPEGMSVSACEGIVWGFGNGVKGKTLQAAAWYLRYYLDDSNNPLMADYYPTDHPECWEIMNWMWEQPIRSYNSVGVITDGGEHNAYAIQYSLVDEVATRAQLKPQLYQWGGVIQSNIDRLESQEGHTCYYGYACDPVCDICGMERAIEHHTYDGPADDRCNVCNFYRGGKPAGDNLVPNSGFKNGLESWQEWGQNGTYEEGADYSAKVLDVEDSEDGKVLEFKLNHGYDSWGNLDLGSDWFGIHLDGIPVEPNTPYQLKIRYKIAPDALFEADESNYVHRMSGYLFVRGLDSNGEGTGLGDIYDGTLGSAYMMNGSKNEWREDTVNFTTCDGEYVGLDLRAVSWGGTPVHYYIDSIELLAYAVQVDAGDVDGTGHVSLKDIGLLQRYLNGWNVDIHFDSSDVTGDGKVNVKDLAMLQQYLNHWEVTLYQH